MSTKTKANIIHRDMTRMEKTISALLFVMLVVFIYLSLPLSRLQAIYVLNSGDISNEQIIQASELKVNQHYFETLFFSDKITQRIQEKYPKVKTVKYELNADNQLTLQVEEYPVVASVSVGQEYLSLIQNGHLQNEYVEKYLGSVTAIQWDGPADSLTLFAREFVQLDDSVRLKVANVVYHESDLLTTTLYMQDGNQVKVNYTDFHEKLNYYEQFVANIGSQKGIFDLIVGIFFAPYK